MKKEEKSLMIIVILIVSVLPFMVHFMEYTIASPSPPATGEWIIEQGETVTLTDQVIQLNGSLVIKGQLTLQNTTIVMAGTSNGANDGELNVTITSTGSLTMGSRSVLTTDTGYYTYMKVEHGGTLTITDSIIQHVGYTGQAGVEVLADNVQIRDSSIENPGGRSFYVDSVTSFTLENVTFNYGVSYNSYAMLIRNTTGVTLHSIKINQTLVTSGVDIETSSNIDIQNCFLNVTDFAFFIRDSSGITVQDNSIYSLVDALHLLNSTNIIIENNKVGSGLRGIFLQEITLLNVNNNHINLITGVIGASIGMYLVDPLINVQITNNIIEGQTYGVLAIGGLVPENSVIMQGNEIREFTVTGVHLQSTMGFNVHENVFETTAINASGVVTVSVPYSVIYNNSFGDFKGASARIFQGKLNLTGTIIQLGHIEAPRENGISFNDAYGFTLSDMELIDIYDTPLNITSSHDFVLKNILINGTQFATMTGSDFNGVVINDSENATVSDLTVLNMDAKIPVGIFLNTVNNITIQNSEFIRSRYIAIYGSYVSNSVFKGINIASHANGMSFWHGTNITITSVNIKEISSIGINLYKGNNITVSHSSFADMVTSLNVYDVTYLTMNSNSMSNGVYGVMCQTVQNVTLSNSQIIGFMVGFESFGASNSNITIKENWLSENIRALYLVNTEDSMVRSNFFMNNRGEVVYISGTISGTRVTENIFINSTGTALIINGLGVTIDRNVFLSDDIAVVSQQNNTYYFNDFILNRVDAIDEAWSQWNYTTFGNYWDEYQGQPSQDSPEIGATPYEFQPNHFDYYPRIHPRASYLPPIITNPSNITYELGTTGHAITWIAFDLQPLNYTLMKDGMIIDSGPWIEYILQYTINVDYLSLGDHNFTLILGDNDGNIVSSTVIVIVVQATFPDTTNPLITGNSTISITVSTPYILQWTIGDEHPRSYEIYRNGELINQEDWAVNQTVSIIITEDSLGEVNYTIVVYDTFGNKASFTTMIQVTQSETTKANTSFFDSIPPAVLYGIGGIAIIAIIGALGLYVFKKKKAQGGNVKAKKPAIRNRQ